MRRSSFASLGSAVVALTLGACGGGSSGGTGTAGSSGNAGANGSAGAGTAGATSGSAGSSTAGATGTAGVSGSAGTVGTAGAGGAVGTAGGMGAAGTTGGAGTTGTAGAGGTTVMGHVMSPGCSKDNTDSPTKWTAHNIMVTAIAAAYKPSYTNRLYWSRPPAGYDKTKPYHLIIWGQGCQLGLQPDNPIPPTNNPEATASSIVVELDPNQANHQCFSAGPDGDNADSPEIPYFDQIVSEMENEFCIDESEIFMGGYSSGGWFSSLMSCVRTNVIRGTGWAAAGLQKNHDACMGPVPALITRGMTDVGTPLDQTMQAVESIRMRNGCATTTKPWMPTWNAGEEKADTSSCVTYDGCMAGYPLVWCPTPGAHTNTENDTHLTRDGLWKLWSTLPN